MAADKQALRDAYAAFDQGDADTVLERFDVFGPGTSPSDELGVDVDKVVQDGATVVVLGTWKTGDALEGPFAHAYTMKNGKAVEFRNYTDTAAYLQALAEAEEEPGDRPLGYPRRG
jgi:ketosteroid isomerase-like protein